MVEQWSTLTPSGFPIELTVTSADSTLRWTAEVAGPEIAESRRLDLVAMQLAAAEQPVSVALLNALRTMQRDQELRYGAWLGGRAVDGASSRFKLYAEIPASTRYEDLLPPALRQVCARLPRGALPRMLGVEPARNRIEIYIRLPMLDVDDLRPLLDAAGYAHGLNALERNLPDGKRRLAGRRLGVSVAIANETSIDVALFASARSLFPGAPEVLRKLVPAVARISASPARLTLVTLGLDPKSHAMSCAVGVTAAPTRRKNAVIFGEASSSLRLTRRAIVGY